jgi:hypothetical protein
VTPGQAATRIRSALEDMSEALGRNDLEAAGKLAARLDAACAEASAAGVQLEAAEREAIADTFQRCGEAAERRAADLKALLLQSGDSRRASDAYRSR